jgi:agmatinase
LFILYQWHSIIIYYERLQIEVDSKSLILTVISGLLGLNRNANLKNNSKGRKYIYQEKVDFMTAKSTFAGLPACANVGDAPADISIIGIPHGTPYIAGQPSHSAGAPAAIRRAAERYAPMLDHYDFDLGGPLLGNRNIRVVDCGDVPGDAWNSADNQKRAMEAIRSVVSAGAVPIVLGGDDSVAIPVFHAYQNHGPLTVIQVDAHLDWRHEVNGITEGASSTMRRASEMPWINTLIQVGLRGVGSARQEEVAAAQAYGARILTAREVHEGGIERILDLVPGGSACLVTIDCDGLDPSIMPAVNAPAPGGLSYRLVVDLIHRLVEKAEVHGFTLVEFVPQKDINGLGALTAARIVFNMIGALARSNRL